MKCDIKKKALVTAITSTPKVKHQIDKIIISHLELKIKPPIINFKGLVKKDSK